MPSSVSTVLLVSAAIIGGTAALVLLAIALVIELGLVLVLSGGS